jgi:hypothetical protein
LVGVTVVAAIGHNLNTAAIGSPPTALPGRRHLILNLILAVINWVEGVLNFTYVESI